MRTSEARLPRALVFPVEPQEAVRAHPRPGPTPAGSAFTVDAHCVSQLSSCNPGSQGTLERPCWYTDGCRATPGSQGPFHSALASHSDLNDPAAGQVREFPIYSLESPARPTALKNLWPLST